MLQLIVHNLAVEFLETAFAVGLLETAFAVEFLETAFAVEFLETAFVVEFLETAFVAEFLKTAGLETSLLLCFSASCIPMATCSWPEGKSTSRAKERCVRTF